jgi:hypothetical protein
MGETFRSPWLRLTWPELRDEYTYVIGFEEFIEQCIGQEGKHRLTGPTPPQPLAHKRAP